MAENNPQEKILAMIKAKYKDNANKALSIEHILTTNEYLSVAGELFKQYPSIQATYNVGANGNKIQLVIGYI